LIERSVSTNRQDWFSLRPWFGCGLAVNDDDV
jgi:hypothetical protein